MGVVCGDGDDDDYLWQRHDEGDGSALDAMW